MKTYEERSFISKHTILTKMICDLCGKVSGRDDWIIPERDFFYDVEETTIKWESGSRYPEGGSDVEVVSFDICPKCFEDKLVPWMEAQGATKTITEEE
jgi:hypothetical protein